MWSWCKYKFNASLYFQGIGFRRPEADYYLLQLVDRSIKYPLGVIEDMLIKVDKFYFLIDFIVLDMEEDSNIPLIFGIPFLATRTLIDVEEGELILRVQDG